MCGIVGYIGPKRVVPLILDGLRRLEYRGYDSAGIAVVGDNGKLQIRRAPGKLRNLEESIRITPLDGLYGIGHTRWATHGRPTEENAHPHRDCTGEIVVVHNGIIENYVELKNQLLAEGHKFLTETDTEIIAHLVEKFSKDATLEGAVLKTVKVMTGAYALVVVSAKDPNKIVAARLGPPIVVGLGDNEFFVASDIPAILAHTRSIFFLGDGEMAVLTPQGVRLFDLKAILSLAPPSTLPGTRSWPKRAASSISCRRKSSSSLAPSAIRCSAEFRRKQATSSSTRWISPRKSSAIFAM